MQKKDLLDVSETAKIQLKKMFKMCDAVESSNLHSLPFKWRTEVYAKIHNKLELPIEWVLQTQKEVEAFPHRNHNNLTDELDIVSMRVELVLTKTLLVYERLNTFYK
jgi:hypothetical protein